ncbi:hypothetical protein ACJIZ3_007559 [Penstemon smallii]|uniref:Xyloglucan endotransglucosylase/hydrolase n=1 Tax=Penstemon smallii TaxID=265156 RepID=A0ABD3T8A4_9LAMI
MVVHLLAFLLIVSFFSSSESSIIDQPTLSFSEGFHPLYGELNVVPHEANKSVHISMDERSSSGFRSKLMYVHGYFESSIRLPENYSAGVVVTFYACNNQKFPYVHDEIDFEFLGHIDGQEWLVQTNFYGNGSTNRGREERYVLWFDPSEDFHRYGILWTGNRITYYVDHVPIRHVIRKVDSNSIGADFPSKEMRLYGTIWNGSNWATMGGKYKLDLTNYGPYVAKFSNFVLNNNNTGSLIWNENENEMMSEEDTRHMRTFRNKYMTYSYCYDYKRYAVALPECVFYSDEFAHLQKFDPWTFGSGGNKASN